METPVTDPTLMESFLSFATAYLVGFMILLFVTGAVLKALIYYTVRRQEWFSKEFEKRVDNFMDDRNPDSKVSFYMIVKRLLEKTYYELFRVRYAMKRRKPDVLMTVADRLFLVKQGSAFFVNDILKPLRHVKYVDSNHPKLFSTTKKAFARNPSFSKVLGLFPSSRMNDVVNILPGVFIILGVFGTFVGIMKALPLLGTMDLNDIDAANATMDKFLLKISFSMSTSLVGIVLSVTMSFLNAALAPEKVFINAVDRFEAALDALWHLSSDNQVPENLQEFNENRHPDEVLAEQALNEDIILGKKQRKMNRVAWSFSFSTSKNKNLVFLARAIHGPPLSPSWGYGRHKDEVFVF